MRLALIYPAADPTGPGQWSGIPSGLCSGFQALGIEVVPVGARLPWLVGPAVAAVSRAGGRRGHLAHTSPVQAFARAKALGQALADAGPVDAALALGTDMYELERVVPTGLRTATFDDGTFVTFSRHRDSDVRQARFPDPEVARWADRQRQACRRADACFVSTSWAGRSVVADYGVSASRVHVVGMGHRPRSVPAGGGRDWSQPRFLYVGVDWIRKNGDAVLRSFAALRADHPLATLDLVGKHPVVDQPGVRGHGHLRREVPADQRHLDTLFGAATTFVLPSRFDPSPIAYLEAASAGLPVIATDQGGAAELLSSAVVVDPRDEHALTRAMLLLADPAEARRRGSVAQAEAARSSWTLVAERMLGVLTVGREDVSAARRRG